MISDLILIFKIAKHEKFKKNCTILRNYVTKLINNGHTTLQNDTVDFEPLDDTFNQLKIKASNLGEVNNKTEPLFSLD